MHGRRGKLSQLQPWPVAQRGVRIRAKISRDVGIADAHQELPRHRRPAHCE